VKESVACYTLLGWRNLGLHYRAIPSICSLQQFTVGIVQLKPDGTQWRMGGEVKGKLANGVGSQYSHTTSERGVSSITNADLHTSAASSRLNWRPHRFKWTRPFRRKTKSGFCACDITFQTHSTSVVYFLSRIQNSLCNVMEVMACISHTCIGTKFVPNNVVQGAQFYKPGHHGD